MDWNWQLWMTAIVLPRCVSWELQEIIFLESSLTLLAHTLICNPQGSRHFWRDVVLTKGGKLTAWKGEACEQQSTSSRARGAPSHPSHRHKPDKHTSRSYCSYLHTVVETICTVCPGIQQWMLLSRWKQASFELRDGEGPHRASWYLLWSSLPVQEVTVSAMSWNLIQFHTPTWSPQLGRESSRFQPFS